MANILLGEAQLKSLCELLADINTHTEIDNYLAQSGIKNEGVPTKTVGVFTQYGSNKKDKLYNSFVGENNKSHNHAKIYNYIERVAAPALYVGQPEAHKNLVECINKVLLFSGLSLNQSGKMAVVPKADTLDEVERRINSINPELYKRKIHSEVTKYCNKDLLVKDYFDAVFEAAKGMAERVRQITGLTSDGSDLFQTAFAKKDPYVYLNAQKTETDWNEHNGLREMMEAVFHMVRNPAAHTPKINWKVEEDKALDVLTIISFIHKYLEITDKIPGK